MVAWLLIVGGVFLVLGLVVLSLAVPLAGRLAGARHRPELAPVARGGTSHDRMTALIESQVSARRAQSRLARTLRRAGMALTLIAAFPLAAGLIVLLSR